MIDLQTNEQIEITKRTFEQEFEKIGEQIASCPEADISRVYISETSEKFFQKIYDFLTSNNLEGIVSKVGNDMATSWNLGTLNNLTLESLGNFLAQTNPILNREITDRILLEISETEGDQNFQKIKNGFFTALKKVSEESLIDRIKLHLNENLVQNTQAPIMVEYLTNRSIAQKRLAQLQNIRASLEVSLNELKDIPEDIEFKNLKFVLRSDEDEILPMQLVQARKSMLQLYSSYLLSLIQETIVYLNHDNVYDTGETLYDRLNDAVRQEISRENVASIASAKGYDVDSKGNILPKGITADNYKQELDEIEFEMESLNLEPELQAKLEKLKQFQTLNLGSQSAQIFHLVVENVLSKLGLLSDEVTKAHQTDAKDQNSSPVTTIKTYAVRTKDRKGAVSVDHTYRVLTIPQSSERNVLKTISIAAHEITHVLQRIARDQTVIPGLEKTGSIGKAGVLSEAGALKIERIVKGLFGVKSAINSSHLETTIRVARGESYWRAFAVVLKQQEESEDVSNAEANLDTILSTSLRRLERVYKNLGNTSSLLNFASRKPVTSTDQLDYIAQALPMFQDLPYYVTGLPIDKIDALKDLISMPKDLVSGSNEAITANRLIKLVIEAVFEELQKRHFL